MSDNKNGSFRSWLMPAMCMIMLGATCLLSTGMSINLAAVRADYGLSATSTSTVMTFRAIFGFLGVFVADRYFKIFGIRKGVALATLVGALAFLVYALADGRIGLYYFGGALAGINYAYALMFPVSMLMKRWFNRHRGKALAIASAGTGLSSVIGAPLVQSVIDSSGVKTAFLWQGAFLLAVAVLLFFTIVDDPAQAGLEPVGGKDFVEEKKQKASSGSAVKLSKKWIVLMVAATTMVGITASPASSHITINFTNNGYDAMTVARSMSVYGIMLIASKLVFGTVIDRFGALKTTILYTILVIIGKGMVGPGGTFIVSTGWLYAAMIMFGISVPIETLGYPNWCADLTSPEDYPAMLKNMQLGYQLGGLLCSSVPGIICDATGSYGWFYFICSILSAGFCVIVFSAYRKHK